MLRRSLRGELLVHVPWAGEGHVDHRLARAAAERVFEDHQIVYYDDYPYASSTSGTGALPRGDGRLPVRVALSPSELTAKLDTIWCYRSQLMWLFGSPRGRRVAKGLACLSAMSGVPIPVPDLPAHGARRLAQVGCRRRALGQERYWWPASRGRAACEGTAGSEEVGPRPLRILLVNAFHYLRGGVERAYLDESRWLEAAGQTPAHYAVLHPRNLPSPTSQFFAPAAEYGANTPVRGLLAQLPSAIWSRAAGLGVARLVDSFRPDVAHIHAPSRYLTPAVLRPLQEAGVPIVMTLHDFKPWCTNRMLYSGGAYCERCLGGRHWHALAAGCVQGSRLKSAVGMIEAYLHDYVAAYRSVALWIAPSRFVEERALRLGVPPSRIRLLRHAVAFEPPAVLVARANGTPARPYVLYAGRLSVEKGAALLPGIARGLGDTATLLVAGDGPLRESLEAEAARLPNLELVGHRSSGDLAALRRGAGAIVVPSVVSETFCFAVAEALMDSRPVVASCVGAIPELVQHEVSGLLVEPGDVDGFVAALKRALGSPDAPAWGAQGRRALVASTSPDRHVAGLLEIYRDASRLVGCA
jgi:glycosyltransferase involved in cell wall biosynthesis